MNSEAPGLQQRRHTRAKTDTGSRVDNDDSEDDMDGFFDPEEHSPGAGNGSNGGSTGDGVPTRTDSNVDDMNGIKFSLHSYLLIAHSYSASAPANNQSVRQATSMTRINSARSSRTRRR